MKRFLQEFLRFGVKQAEACLFGGVLLALILLSKMVWQEDWILARYDFLFLSALVVQILFLLFKLETLKEAKVIFVFHIVGTLMELFKTHVGSWEYPEANLIRLAGVPLFSGFMYSAVGSYIARATRIFRVSYEPYPRVWLTGLLCLAIYANFFTHHFTLDVRFFLFLATGVLFWKTRALYTINKTARSMPILLSFLLISFFIWIAENIATYARIWIYPSQQIWQMVPIAKLGSWYLLMIISFVLVKLVEESKRGITSRE